MTIEFEGKTEKEAIDKAIAELGLQRDEFDVEIVETGKKGLFFKKGNVKIKVHLNTTTIYGKPAKTEESGEKPYRAMRQENAENFAVAEIKEIAVETECEKKTKEFLEKMLEKADLAGTVIMNFREEKKIGFMIKSEFSGILIGKKGKNLDAIQLLANVFAGRDQTAPRVIVDTENYRGRKEESLIRLARRSAEYVKRSRRSKLLEPMNPFERRIIHTALNDMEDIATKSDGEGLFKQVRIFYRGRGSR